MNAYLRLMRCHQPVGIFLLLWPTLIALWVGSSGIPNGKMLSVFTLGVIVMRAAGCVINDCTDVRFDRHVARTQVRPLAAGEITRREALLVLVGLLSLALMLLLCLPMRAWPYGAGALILTAVYPWMKRVVSFPQLILGIAFAFSIPMVFISIQNTLPVTSGLLFLATVLWTIAYDTLYAKSDREDDLKIGVKSTAILFGKWDNAAALMMQMMALVLFVIVGTMLSVRPLFYIGMGLAVLSTIYQSYLLRVKKQHFRAFLNNVWWGGFVFLAFVLGFL